MGEACLATSRHNRYRPDNRYIFTFLRGNMKISLFVGMLWRVKHAKTPVQRCENLCGKVERKAQDHAVTGFDGLLLAQPTLEFHALAML